MLTFGSDTDLGSICHMVPVWKYWTISNRYVERCGLTSNGRRHINDVWRGGSMVSVRDSRSEGREFDPRPRHTA